MLCFSVCAQLCLANRSLVCCQKPSLLSSPSSSPLTPRPLRKHRCGLIASSNLATPLPRCQPTPLPGCSGGPLPRDCRLASHPVTSCYTKTRGDLVQGRCLFKDICTALSVLGGVIITVLNTEMKISRKSLDMKYVFMFVL